MSFDWLGGGWRAILRDLVNASLAEGVILMGGWRMRLFKERSCG
jgi:hypothetical protein